MAPWMWVVIGVAAVLFLLLLFRPGRAGYRRGPAVVAPGPRRRWWGGGWRRRPLARRW
jgi:hypothetical protein